VPALFDGVMDDRRNIGRAPWKRSAFQLTVLAQMGSARLPLRLRGCEPTFEASFKNSDVYRVEVRGLLSSYRAETTA